MTSVLLGPKGKILVGLWERDVMAVHMLCRRDRISAAEAVSWSAGHGVKDEKWVKGGGNRVGHQGIANGVGWLGLH